jgi:hypothetical protein
MVEGNTSMSSLHYGRLLSMAALSFLSDRLLDSHPATGSHLGQAVPQIEDSAPDHLQPAG